MIYDPVSLRVTGCQEGQCVSIRASIMDDDEVRWESVNNFVPRNGVMDLERQAPDDGMYAGVEPMGFVWSMQPQTDEPGLFKHDTLAPLHMDLSVEVAGERLATETLERWVVRPNVQRTEVRTDGLVGTLFAPQRASALPGIIVIGGSGGGLREGQAALLASAGYPALALAYFAEEGLPKSLEEIPLEYFERAIHFMQRRPEVDGERIAVLGGSRGGELSLLLGATFPEIKCVIAYAPSGLIWGGFPNEGAAWTYQGKPLPSVD
jgi:fermentation-respiration switch protein FrsA (DUF1100 family)